MQQSSKLFYRSSTLLLSTKKLIVCHIKIRKILNKQKERWTRRKVEAILYKGGKCAVCGITYNGCNGSIFDFHHINPKEKEFTWDKLKLRNIEDIKKELDKEICVCSNCHRLIHSKEF